MDNILPVITLYQPWATWIMRGWKTIETRTHSRFACLNGKTVLIHAGKTFDNSDAVLFNPYLNVLQVVESTEKPIQGSILGTALINGVGWINSTHSSQALIECITPRYGLFLDNITVFDEPIPVLGGMGIWYYDIVKREKVKVNAIKSKYFQTEIFNHH